MAASRKNPLAEPGRMIVVMTDTGNSLKLFTNDLDSSAEAVAGFYKTRRQIELFFRWIKAEPAHPAFPRPLRECRPAADRRRRHHLPALEAQSYRRPDEEDPPSSSPHSATPSFTTSRSKPWAAGSNGGTPRPTRFHRRNWSSQFEASNVPDSRGTTPATPSG